MGRPYFKLLILLTVISSLAVLCGCDTYDSFKTEFVSDDAKQEEVIYIGVFEPMSGKESSQAKYELKGIELANSMYPTADGKKVELIYADNKSDINTGESVIQDLIEKKPTMILGSYGNINSLVAGKYIKKAGIPAIAMTCTNPLVTANNPYYFRVCYTDSYQGVALADYAISTGKSRRIALMVPQNDDHATVLEKRFAIEAKRKSGRKNIIRFQCRYTPGQMEFDDIIRLMKKNKIDSVFLPGKTEDVINFAKAAYKKGLRLNIYATDALNNEKLAKTAGAKVASTIYFSESSAEISMLKGSSNETQVFVDQYKDSEKQGSLQKNNTALGYDAYMLAINTLENCGSDASGAKIRDALLKTKDYKGASGTIIFDKSGDPIKSIGIYSVRNKEVLPICVVEPDGDIIQVIK